MRYALTGTEKCLVWRSTVFPFSARPWRVSMGNNGAPLGTPVWFATWREAMDYATGVA
jgi:hypothetical protein